MPDIPTPEDLERMSLERYDMEERQRESVSRQRRYANKVRIKDLDLTIKTAEYVLQVAEIPYRKRNITEKGRERKQRTSYLAQLLSIAELSR